MREMLHVLNVGHWSDDGECLTDVGWTFRKRFAQTVVTHDDGDYLLLHLVIDGFDGDDMSTKLDQEIAELSFEFETQCAPDCAFVLLMVCHSLRVGDNDNRE